MKPSTTALNTLLASRQFFAANLFQYTLIDGTTLYYAGSDTDITYGGHTYSAGGTAGPTLQHPPFHVPDMSAYYPAAEPLYMGAGSYYDQLGFFCKRELDIQKATHLPVFFRLGSLESCNKLEGK